MSEVSNKRFVHFDGTKQEFIAGGYPSTYTDSIVFINGDGNESNNTIYTHGEYYGQGVIVEGDASNSAVLTNADNTSISEYSISLGSKCTSGLKGWYYKAIQFNTSSKTTFLYFTKTQQIPVVITTAIGYDYETDVPFSLKPGVIMSVVNDAKYDNKYKITTVDKNYGRIGLKSVDDANPFPFLDVVTDDELLKGIFSPEDYSFYALDHPSAGIYDIGQNSLSVGEDNIASNNSAIALGYKNHAYGKFSFCVGRNNEAGYAAHAEGRGTKAIGELSHAEGLSTIASANISHAEGRDTETYGEVSHAEGLLGKTYGLASHVEGAYCKAYGDYSHCEGYSTQVKENASASHTEGYNCITGGNYTSNKLTIGSNTNNGAYSHAEGNATISCGIGSHSEGKATLSSGEASHAEGYKTIASGNYSHAEGYNNSAFGECSHVGGLNNISYSNNAFVHGEDNNEILYTGYYVSYILEVDAVRSRMYLSKTQKYCEYIYTDTVDDIVTEEDIQMVYNVGDYIYFIDTDYPWSGMPQITKIGDGYIDVDDAFARNKDGEEISLYLPGIKGSYIYKSTKTTPYRLASHNVSIVLGKGLLCNNTNTVVIGTYNKETNASFVIGNGDDNLTRSNIVEIDKTSVNIITPNFFVNGKCCLVLPTERIDAGGESAHIYPFRRYINNSNIKKFILEDKYVGAEYYFIHHNKGQSIPTITANDENYPLRWANDIELNDLEGEYFEICMLVLPDTVLCTATSYNYLV